jgi:hypothetical protein
MTQAPSTQIAGYLGTTWPRPWSTSTALSYVKPIQLTGKSMVDHHNDSTLGDVPLEDGDEAVHQLVVHRGV